MLTKQPIFQNANWISLTILPSLIFAMVIIIMQKMFGYVAPDMLIQFSLVVIGCMSVMIGFVVTKSRQYELSPLRLQIFGSVVEGIMLTGILYAGLKLLSILPFGATIILYVVSVILWIEFISQRIAQRKKITAWQVMAACLVGLSVYLVMNTLPFTAGTLLLFVLVSSIIMNIISRLTGTYLLSPWVNSFWNGIPFILIGSLGLPFLTNFAHGASFSNMLLLPLWIGIIIFLIASVLLLMRLLKHKALISRGYMQYKLQSTTGVLALLSLIFMGSFDITILFAFVILCFSYAVSEARLLIRE